MGRDQDQSPTRAAGVGLFAGGQNRLERVPIPIVVDQLLSVLADGEANTYALAGAHIARQSIQGDHGPAAGQSWGRQQQHSRQRYYETEVQPTTHDVTSLYHSDRTPELARSSPPRFDPQHTPRALCAGDRAE